MGEVAWPRESAVQLGFPPLVSPSAAAAPVEPHGVVYTKPWVVELILNLAGYTPEHDLAAAFAVEPAAGDGAFLVSMVTRLVASCARYERSILDTADALLAYELADESAVLARTAIIRTLREHGVSDTDARFLADRWIHTGDYLLDAPTLPKADFVIGNPPYIRLEDMDNQVAATYRAMYRTMQGRADIYVAFFEAALRQLRPAGVCAYICADRWMLNQYGAALRGMVSAGFSVEAVVEMHTAEPFLSDVSAYPAVTVIRRVAQGSVVVARATREAEETGAECLAAQLMTVRGGVTTTRDAGRVASSTHPNGLVLPGMTAARVEDWFQNDDPWPLLSPQRLALLRYLEAHFPPLESAETRTKVGIGVATGADDIFITTDPQLVEFDRLLPLAMASDAVDGVVRWSGHYLVDPWTPEGLVSLTDYPRLKAYLERHAERLRQRHVGQRSGPRWYRTIDRVNHSLTGKPKLYLPDIKDRIEPFFDRGETYPHHNLYVVQSEAWDHEVLGGLLLSAIGQFFVECYGVRMRGDTCASKPSTCAASGSRGRRRSRRSSKHSSGRPSAGAIATWRLRSPWRSTASQRSPRRCPAHEQPQCALSGSRAALLGRPGKAAAETGRGGAY